MGPVRSDMPQALPSQKDGDDMLRETVGEDPSGPLELGAEGVEERGRLKLIGFPAIKYLWVERRAWMSIVCREIVYKCSQGMYR